MKCLRIFFLLSLIFQLSISQIVKGKSDDITFYNKAGCTILVPIMDFWVIEPFQDYPVLAINSKTKGWLYADSKENKLLLRTGIVPQDILDSHRDIKSNNPFLKLCDILRPGRNTLELRKVLKEEKFERVDGSEFNIYKWKMDSKVVIIDYPCISKIGYFSDDVSE